jgi:hypothetical protein
MTGRPTSFKQSTGDEICKRLAEGESLRGICRDDHMPAASTVFGWLAGSDEKLRPFMEQYARAREAQADNLVDEILEISDDGTNDWMERRSEAEKGAGVESGWVLNGEHVQRSRLRVDSRKWFASKVYPKKYADKIQQEISGKDGGPLKVTWED